MPYYLGLDVGGTKTWCLIADGTGRIVGFGRAGTGSYEYHGVAPAAIENRKAVDAALADAGISPAQISRAGLGVAGADLPEDFEMLEREIYGPLFGTIPRVFKNDSFAALHGGSEDGTGVVVACGTGCTCAGRGRDGRETRVGGLGPEFGDACTGTSIGEEGLRAVWRARDGIIGPTRLTDLFLERSGCADLEELFTLRYREAPLPRSLEPMAEVVFNAALEGDCAARDILERGGDYLGAMALAVARRLDITGEPFTLVTAGSVFRGASSVLKDALEARVRQECGEVRIVMPRFQPVVGALLLGMDGEVSMSDTFYAILSESLDANKSYTGHVEKVG